MKKMFIIYFIFVSMLICNTLEEAKWLSYNGSVHYINRDFIVSNKNFKESLSIRKRLGKIDKAYVTILKLYILSSFRSGDYCDLSLDTDDKILLLSDNDFDFLHEYEMIKSSCFSF